VSFDTLESHKQFAANHNLAFPLVSDDGSIAKKYGVHVTEQPDGCAEDKSAKTCARYADRVTFVIDKTGKVVRKFGHVNIDGHADEVLKVLQSL